MRYRDPLYGESRLPDFIGELADTPLVQRLKNISQDSVPNSMLPTPMTCRYEHSLGVCKLLSETIARNPHLERDETLLYVAALLHDAGNPAFSHLCEPFLRKLTGKDGESFLEETIEKFKMNERLGTLGLATEHVVRFITGNARPLSDILHGSMDVDNLDNVNRYWSAHHEQRAPYDPVRIASSYRFTNECWVLPFSLMRETEGWKSARELVYKLIYDEPHLSAAMMLYRAVYLSCLTGEITESFFHLTDFEAVEFLARHNAHSAHLIQRALRHEWYPLVFSMETTTPSEAFKKSCAYEEFRSIDADIIGTETGIPPEAICIYAGKGRDRRRIDLPFISPNGHVTRDASAPRPIYRFKAYLDPDYLHKKSKVIMLAKRCID